MPLAIPAMMQKVKPRRSIRHWADRANRRVANNKLVVMMSRNVSRAAGCSPNRIAARANGVARLKQNVDDKAMSQPCNGRALVEAGSVFAKLFTFGLNRLYLDAGIAGDGCQDGAAFVTGYASHTGAGLLAGASAFDKTPGSQPAKALTPRQYVA